MTMAHGLDVLRSGSLAVGTAVTVLAALRLIVCTIFIAQDLSDSHYQSAHVVLIILAVANAVELLVDGLLILGMIKRISQLMFVWLVCSVVLMFVNFGLCGKLISISYTAGTGHVTLPLYIYTVINALATIVFIAIIKLYYRQVVNEELRGPPGMPSAAILIRHDQY